MRGTENPTQPYLPPLPKTKADSLNEVILADEPEEIGTECNSCGSSYSDSDFCSNCLYCNYCCECLLCSNCGSACYNEDIDEEGDGDDNYAYCFQCHRCRSCCTCTQDQYWEGRLLKLERPEIDFDQFNEIDVVQAMADFYTLSYIEGETNQVEACTDVEYREAVRVYAKQASQLKDELVRQLDPVFRLYIDFAVGGELRHHRYFRRSTRISRVRKLAWREWLSLRDQVGPDALKTAAQLFTDGTLTGAYGGKPWANAAEILYKRYIGEIPPWLFVDRVFTMQHNGGSLLNKVTWATRTQLEYQQPDHCKYVGDAHAAEEPNLDFLVMLCSNRVRSLINDWWRALNRARIAMGLPVKIRPDPQRRIESYYRGYDSKIHRKFRLGAGENKEYIQLKPVKVDKKLVDESDLCGELEGGYGDCPCVLLKHHDDSHACKHDVEF